MEGSKEKKIFIICHQALYDDKIEVGNHIRWGFKPKMGFPEGGFCLFRRQRIFSYKPTYTSFISFENFKDKKLEDHMFSKPLSTGLFHGDKEILIEIFHRTDYGTINNWKILHTQVYKNQFKYFLRYNSSSNFMLYVHFSHPMKNISIEGYIKKNGRFEVSAYETDDETHQVDANSFKTENATQMGQLRIQKINLGYLHNNKVNNIKSITIKGNSAGIRQINFIPNVSPLNTRWEQIYPRNGSLFLPSNWNEAQKRLPKLSFKSKSKFENGFNESSELISILLDKSKKIPMAGRTISKEPEALDKPHIKTKEPSPVEFSVLDLTLLASLHPGIAKMLGLYYVDNVGTKDSEYKIIGDYPKDTHWHLDNSIDFEDYRVGENFSAHTILPEQETKLHIILHGKFSSMVSMINYSGKLGNFKHALMIEPKRYSFKEPFIFRIYFEKPVGEVQLFIKQQIVISSIPFGGLTAYRKGKESVSYGKLTAYKAGKEGKEEVDQVMHKEAETILSVHAPSIDFVELIGQKAYILKICYDEEYIWYGEHYDITDVKHYKKPTPPNFVKATLLPCVTKKRYFYGQELLQGAFLDSLQCVGLRWKLPADLETNPEASLKPNDPVRYIVRREKKPEGKKVNITKNPIVVTPIDTTDTPKQFSGWPKERQYFIDQIPMKSFKDSIDISEYSYYVAGIDIWGRISDYSDPASIKLDKLPPPPPPVNIEAKILDPGDPWLLTKNDILDSGKKISEKNWVDKYKAHGIKINWQWTERLQRQAPGAKKFHIYFQPGWLNLIQGRIIDVEDIDGKSRLGTDYTVTYEISPNVPQSSINQSLNKYNNIGDYLQISGKRYEIIGSILIKDKEEVDSFYPVKRLIYNLVLTVKHPDDSEDHPQKGEFALPILPSSPLFKNFNIPSSWSDSLHIEEIRKSKKLDYQVVLKNPPLVTSQDEPLLYGQIGISTSNVFEEGSVSSPVTIFSVFRTAPPRPDCPDLKCPESKNIYAGLPDFFNKSSFTIRWPRRERMNYEVCRAMDNTLFMIDREARENRSRNSEDKIYKAVLEDFSKQYPEPTHPGLMDRVHELIQNPTVEYDSLDNYLLQALASFPDNEKAFSKIHDHQIKSDDVRYRDPKNPVMMVYVDNTLDGKAKNRYFYRICVTDGIGNKSSYSFSTPPIYLPETIPPRAPVIAKVLGGDRQIIIQWSRNPEENLLGYYVYRTRHKEKANDIRTMEKVAEVLSEDSHRFVVSYTDNDLIGNQIYFYRIVAVCIGHIDTDVTQQIYSSSSKIITAKTYDLSTPNPPVWFKIVPSVLKQKGHKVSKLIIYTAVNIYWAVCEPNIRCLLQRREDGSSYWTTITNWIEPQSYNKKKNWWVYKFNDKPEDMGINYFYRLKLINLAGKILEEEREYKVTLNN